MKTISCNLGQTIYHLALLITSSSRAGITLPCLPGTLWRQTSWDLCLEGCSQDKTTQVHATTLLEELQQRNQIDEMELVNYLSPPQVVPHIQISKIADRSTVVAYSGGKRGICFLLWAFSLLNFTRNKSITENGVEGGRKKKKKIRKAAFLRGLWRWDKRAIYMHLKIILLTGAHQYWNIYALYSIDTFYSYADVI